MSLFLIYSWTFGGTHHCKVWVLWGDSGRILRTPPWAGYCYPPSQPVAVCGRGSARLPSDEMSSHTSGVAEGESRSERLWKICVICRGWWTTVVEVLKAWSRQVAFPTWHRVQRNCDADFDPQGQDSFTGPAGPQHSPAPGDIAGLLGFWTSSAPYGLHRVGAGTQTSRNLFKYSSFLITTSGIGNGKNFILRTKGPENSYKPTV